MGASKLLQIYNYPKPDLTKCILASISNIPAKLCVVNKINRHARKMLKKIGSAIHVGFIATL